MSAPKQMLIEGTVSKRFEPVRQAFVENFTRRGELGGACCIYEHGEKVVDLWGGLRDRNRGKPWRQDTLAIVHSATKGLAAMVIALAHSRGWLDYDERIAGYWPEFAQNGKEAITVRQLLAHQAGLFVNLAICFMSARLSQEYCVYLSAPAKTALCSGFQPVRSLSWLGKHEPPHALFLVLALNPETHREHPSHDQRAGCGAARSNDLQRLPFGGCIQDGELRHGASP